VNKILIISSEFPPGPGGIGKHAADLSLALTRKGYLIHVFSPIDYATEFQISEYLKQLPSGIKLFRLKRYGWYTYIHRIIQIHNAIKKCNYERIILTGMFPIWVGAFIKVFYNQNQRIESFIHGSEVRPNNFFKRKLTHWSLNKADKIWAVSGFTASLLPISFKISILPNGIHSEEWVQFISSKPFSNWKGNPRLLTVGNISPRKGQARVIKALPEIIKTFPNVHYHMVGLTSNQKEIKDLSEKLGVEKHISIHGKMEGKAELASTYMSADIFLMLSENQSNGDVEGFGIAILEAAFFGLPTIGAIGCGIQDAILNGKTGQLVDGNSPIEIVESIKSILFNKENYTKNLPAWILKHDWNILVEKIVDDK
jgi:phosphatidylinositol alpha-1,6-mannosyltransferase